MSFTIADAEEALRQLEKIKGRERARLIERMFRLETAHFKSGQYKLSGSAGMEMGNWQGIDESKFSTFRMKDNHLTGDKQMRTFIKWNSVLDFCLYLSDYIDRYDGNFARWNSRDSARQEMYRFRVSQIKNRTVL